MCSIKPVNDRAARHGTKRLSNDVANCRAQLKLARSQESNRDCWIQVRAACFGTAKCPNEDCNTPASSDNDAAASMAFGFRKYNIGNNSIA